MSTQTATEIIYQCLTAECEECTGAYFSDILGKQFVCKCTCHIAGNEQKLTSGDSK